MLDVHAVPLLADNYAYLLRRPRSADCAVVDPSAAAGVRQALVARGLRLRAILVTHPHWDHIGGIEELWRPGVEVTGAAADADKVPHLSRGLTDEAPFCLLGAEVRALQVPGHTRHALAFYVAEAGILFTGDTLFAAGCGRLFEGTAAQMRASLQKLSALPPATKIYCGHEYTRKNLRFAAQEAPELQAVARRLRALHGAPLCTVPSNLELETETNLFLRAPSDLAFAQLRRRRDLFAG